MELIEPKEIELTSNIRKDEDGNSIKKTYKIGFYPSTASFDMLGDSLSLLDIMARKKATGSREQLKESLRAVRSEICKYIHVKLSNGTWLPLDSDPIVDAHVPDREMLGELLLRSHDYNSFFLSSGRTLKIFQNAMNQAKQQASKIFTQLSDSFSAKAGRRSKK